jgi:Papain fold toxin 1, glutamine deamidase
MPEFTIDGDAGAIRARAGVLRSKGELFVSTGEALAKVTTNGWHGRAADHFRDAFEVEPRRWFDAGDGFARAASSLGVYADAVADAQARAAWAEGEYARGEQVTAEARAAYEADVAAARQEVAEAAAQGKMMTLTIEPFQDPGAVIRQGAVAEYQAARAAQDAAAQVCADGVRAGCAAAPEERSWLESGLAAVGGFFAGAGEAIWDLVTLPGSPISLLSDGLDLATGHLTPEEMAVKYRLGVETVGDMLEALAEDPVAFGENLGKALLDWDTWADDPARALGHLVPDAIAAVFTAGAGTMATRGVKGAADVADAAGDLASTGRGLDDLDALQAGARLDDFASDIDGASSVRAIHADSADPGSLDTLLRSRYRAVLGPNSERFANGVPESGLPAEAFQMNCTRCVVATDSSLTGTPASAMPLPAGQPGASIADVAAATGRSWEPADSYGDIVSRSLAEGPGSRGIVFGQRPDVGHVFNVINDNGTVVFLDGQTGSFARLENFGRLLYMPTYP